MLEALRRCAMSVLLLPPAMPMSVDVIRNAGMEQGPLQKYIARLERGFPGESFDALALVNVGHQRLYFLKDRRVKKSYPVSTSRHGLGSDQDSLRTPLGMHKVREKIGQGEPLGRIFKARVPTAALAEPMTEPARTPDDFVTSRILWLDGLEVGVNRGDGIDSFARFIYIHGTHEEGLIGSPASEGCVRMKNADVIELFDM
ncbi:MAG: L,D-transpeptidase family protein, partial [Gammaproteobacteria bacterium]